MSAEALERTREASDVLDQAREVWNGGDPDRAVDLLCRRWAELVAVGEEADAIADAAMRARDSLLR